MTEDKPRKLKDVKREYDEISAIYDETGETFESRQGQCFRLELINKYLSENKNIKILDAGGGTGRITLPLADMGYQVTLCDLSTGMLDVAEEKLGKEGLLEKTEILVTDISHLPFGDQTFDLVLCLASPLSLADSGKAAEELARVLKTGGTIIVDGFGRYCLAMHEFTRNPDLALKLIRSELNYACDRHGDRGRVFAPEELRELFEKNSIKTIEIFGRFMDFIPVEVQNAKEWDEKLFSEVFEIKKCLSHKPSVIGMGEELTLVGEKI